jgi:urease accessory protein
MPSALLVVLGDARSPSNRPAHSGGVEAACAAGLVTDAQTLRAFLDGRLWTSGATGAFAAAAVCNRARGGSPTPSLWRTVEAEIDARIPSPAAREASREQGGRTLRKAMGAADSPVFDGLARACISQGMKPHHPVALGAVAAVAGLPPEEAAETAAYASVAAAAFAAQRLLGLDAEVIERIGLDMAPDIRRLAKDAAEVCDLPLARMPSCSAPVLEFLAEEHAGIARRSFAS